jgi:tRNA A-37 threonylcarbamoyl transferase component Bud32
MKILKKFYSKKNMVYLLEDSQTTAVYKMFSDSDNYLKEKRYYQMFQYTDLSVPDMLNYKDANNSILLEYLQDETALDLMEQYEKNLDYSKASDLLTDIFLWLKTFHGLDDIKSKKLSFYDLNLRNFILRNAKVYGVDFESIQEGDLLSDTAKLIGMYLNYDEKYSAFKNKTVCYFKNFIAKNHYFEISSLEKSIANEILVINNRRNLKSNVL